MLETTSFVTKLMTCGLKNMGRYTPFKNYFRKYKSKTVGGYYPRSYSRTKFKSRRDMAIWYNFIYREANKHREIKQPATNL